MRYLIVEPDACYSHIMCHASRGGVGCMDDSLQCGLHGDTLKPLY